MSKTAYFRIGVFVITATLIGAAGVIVFGAGSFKEKGIIFSFEETSERLRAAARGLGFGLDAEIEKGMIEIVFIAQPDIVIEENLLMMRERSEAFGAKRIAVSELLRGQGA